MSGIDLETDYNSSFRVRGVLAEELECLKKEVLSGHNYREGAYFKNKTLKVLVIPLTKNIDSALLKTVVSRLSKHEGYEFYISTCNSNDGLPILWWTSL